MEIQVTDNTALCLHKKKLKFGNVLSKLSLVLKDQ